MTKQFSVWMKQKFAQTFLMYLMGGTQSFLDCPAFSGHIFNVTVVRPPLVSFMWRGGAIFFKSLMASSEKLGYRNNKQRISDKGFSSNR